MSLPNEEGLPALATDISGPKVPTVRPSGDEALTGPKYTMKISRLTIDKLGIKLYDRVTAVLAELIANSYDADAVKVQITLPWGTTLGGSLRKPVADADVLAASHDSKTKTESIELPAALAAQSLDAVHEISIADNGHGMTSNELNTHYLSVGADRRKRTGSDKSRRKLRPVMGRKGIGKLAPFGICETVEVITAGGDKVTQGWRVSHIILRLQDMLADTEAEYNPEVGSLDGTFTEREGTTIKLRDFFRKRVPSGEELDRQLSARFGLSRDDWTVEVVNSLNESESFELGRLKIDYMDDTLIDVSEMPVPLGDSYLPVAGFIAYAKKPYKDPAMAGVRIYTRGKICAQTRDFDIGSGFTGEFKMRSYLVGEIHAEWLDQEEDLVRSDRQDIIWASDLGEALRDWGQKLIKLIGRRAENSLRREKWLEFERRSNIFQRLEVTRPDPELEVAVTEAAKLLIKDIDPEALTDQEHVDRITDLAFSIAPHQSLLGTLRMVAETTETTIDAVMALFHKARIAEMYSLGQVARRRLEVIAKLEDLVSDGATLERPLQELIEQAPWLLAPEWTPLGTNESLRRVRAAFESWYFKTYHEEIVTSAIEDERKEPDFVMLHDSGVLWVVEIKRLMYYLTDEEYSRGLGYLERLDRFLNDNPELGRQFPIRRLTFIVDHVDRLGFVSLSSLRSDDRITQQTWHGLLDLTQRAHRDFLARVAAMPQADGTEDEGGSTKDKECQEGWEDD